MAGGYVADRRLFLDKDGKVVEENDPTKASLLVGVGGTLPYDRAQALGLIDYEEKVTIKERPDAVANKLRGKAKGNKGTINPDDLATVQGAAVTPGDLATDLANPSTVPQDKA